MTVSSVLTAPGQTTSKYGQNSSDAATHASDDSSAVSGSVNLLLHPIDNNQPMQLVLDTVENKDVIVQQLWERIAMLENQHLTL